MFRTISVFAVAVLSSAYVGAVAPDIKGQIRTIDLEKGTIVLVEGSPKNPVENTYSLARPDIPVTSPTGKPGKLAELKAGLKVGVQLLGADVTAIKIIPVTLVASFVRVDAKGKTLGVRLAGSLTDSIYSFTGEPALEINRKNAGWADLKPGQKIQLIFAGDKTNVVMIQAGADIETAKETRAKLSRQAGILLDYEPAQFKARIIHIGMSHVEKKEYRVAEDAEAKLFHAKRVLRPIALRDLEPLLKVHFFVDLDTKTIVAVDVEMPVIRRRLLALDVDAGKITIEDALKPRMLDLAPGLQVFQDGRPAKIERVKLGLMTGIGLALDRKRVDAIFLTTPDPNKAVK